MPVPTWSVGQVLSASDVNQWFVPVAAIKTADQSVTSSTTFVNDSELVVPLAATGTYQFQCYLNYEGANGGGTGAGCLKWKWIVPAGTTLRYQSIFQGTGTTAVVHLTNIAGDIPNANSLGAGTLMAASMVGSVVVSSTSGTMQLQWAQVTSNATSTIMHPQSCLILRRIG
jgi:hypothetical protein